MSDLIEIAKGVYRTPETVSISINPSDIKVTSHLPPLFGDSRRERIGADLAQLAKEHSQWVAVSANRLFGESGLEHFSSEVDGMRSDGYIVLIGGKKGLIIEPTQQLANFYMEHQSQELS